MRYNAPLTRVALGAGDCARPAPMRFGGTILPSNRAPTILTPPPYLRRTSAASCSDFVTKSEDALELVGRRYGEGVELTLGCPLHSRGNAESACGAARQPRPALRGNLALGGFFLTFAATYFEG